jgi:hypothetical protein
MPQPTDKLNQIQGLVGMNMTTGLIIINADIDHNILCAILEQVVAQMKHDATMREINFQP